MLRVEGLSKRYGSHVANDGISFELPPGLHAVLGENGAGKTTLLRLIAGEERPDVGRISYRGRSLLKPFAKGFGKAAVEGPVALVHQHPRIPPGLTYAEAVSLGREPLRFGFFLDRKRMLLRCTEELREYGGGIDPRARLSSLGFASRQRVEILRAISSGASLIALDEPTSILSTSEADSLYEILSVLAGEGKTIIVVTHRLEEVVARKLPCIVLREGRFQGQLSPDSVHRLSALMFGESGGPVSCAMPSRAVERELRPNFILSAENIPSKRSDEPALKDIHIEVRPGEVCAILALAGNGLGALEDLLAGNAHCAPGTITIDGKDLSAAGMVGRRKAGMGYVPGERKARGLPCQGTAMEAILEAERPIFNRFPGTEQAKKRARASALALPLGLAIDWDTAAMDLSGGESQRLILSREINAARRFLLACDALHGLDSQGRCVAAQSIRHAADRGVAVLLTGSETDDVLPLADRVLVMYRGRIVAEWDDMAGPGVEETILSAMAGIGKVGHVAF